MDLLQNVHVGLDNFTQENRGTVRGDYDYWHYCCDGLNDRGWGCGYRTLQTLCSWMKYQRQKGHSGSPGGDSHVEGSAEMPILALESCTANVADVGISKNDFSDFCNEDMTGITVVTSGEDSDGGQILVGAGHNIHKEVHTDHGTVSVSCVENLAFDSNRAVDALQANQTRTAESSREARSVQDAYLPHSTPTKAMRQVPSIPDIQKALVAMGDKPSNFVGSRQWIGSYEVCLCIDYFYGVPCKILHIDRGSELIKYLTTLEDHFTQFGSPVMMGGDTDASSKGIMGVSLNPPALLVVDPHYTGVTESAASLQKSGWVKWVPLEDFHKTSFYNLCLPQLAAK